MSTIARHDARRRWEYGLTIGEFGAVSGQTTIATVLPLLLHKYASSNFWIGFAVGGEGFFTLIAPFWIGHASDHMSRSLAVRYGRRMLILIAVAPVMALAVAVAPFTRSYWAMTGAAFVFFAALHCYLTPLRTLMLDSVPDERRGRVQGARGVLRSFGLAYGLVAAGLLFAVAPPFPFLVAAGLILATTALTWLAERKAGGDRSPTLGEHNLGTGAFRELWGRLWRSRAALWLLVAGAFWSGAIDGIRPYIFEYGKTVLGLSVAGSAIGLAILVAGIIVGAVIYGWLGDRLPRILLLQIGTGLLTVAFGGATFVRTMPWAAVALAAGGLGAASFVVLGYPLFADLVGEQWHGEYTGLWLFSVGFGRIASPMLVGLVIDLGGRVMPRLQGYPLMWTAASALTALGWLSLWRSLSALREQRAREGEGIITARRG